MTDTEASRVAWIPLESNPDVMTELLGAVKGTWLDVLGFDDEALSCIPQPVVALIFIYATTPQFDRDVKAKNEELRARVSTGPGGVYFMEQTIRNACGAVAVIHALDNNTEDVSLTALRTFLDCSIGLTPHKRGKALEEFKEIEELHKAMAVSGQIAAPAPQDHVGNHFVAFVHRAGRLVELTGGRPFPLDHGPTRVELKDGVRVCRERMEKVLRTAAEADGSDATEYRFAVFALTTAFSD